MDPTPIKLETLLEQRLSRDTGSTRHLSSFIAFTSKTNLSKISVDMNIDDVRARERKDYTHFLGKHEGMNTIIYLPPESGWVTGVAEKEKQKQRSQSSL